MSTYKGRQLGTIGDFGCFSFHYTKNVICGEGGAISINRSSMLARRALVLWEKGTNRYLSLCCEVRHISLIVLNLDTTHICMFLYASRHDFMAGKIDKYEWIDIGSSFVPSEVSCAILWAQIEHSAEITAARISNFNTYHDGLIELHEKHFRIPCVPIQCVTNAHIFSLLLPNKELRAFFETEMKRRGVSAFSHYVPLHSSPAGLKFGRVAGDMTVTNEVFAGLLRLPLWVGLRIDELQFVINAVKDVAELAQTLATKNSGV